MSNATAGQITVDEHGITMPCDWCLGASRWVITEGLNTLPGAPGEQHNYACDECRARHYRHCEFTAQCTDGQRLTYHAADLSAAMRCHNRRRPELRASVAAWITPAPYGSTMAPTTYHGHEPNA